MLTDFRYTVTLDRIIDGDTVVVTVDLGFRLYHQTSLRLAGINAPELATDAGKAARQALVDLLAAKLPPPPAPQELLAVTYKSGVDKYGRWLADLYCPDGTSINEWMLDNGHAVPMGIRPTSGVL